MNIVWKLFGVFLKIGLLSIGGGYAIIPLIQEQVVDQNNWISGKMFTDIITISQMTPGPLAVNTSTYVSEVLNGLKSASLGLIISAAVTILLLALYGSSGPEGNIFSLNRTALLLFLAMLLLLRKRKLNPVVLMLISGIAGLLFYR